MLNSLFLIYCISFILIIIVISFIFVNHFLYEAWFLICFMKENLTKLEKNLKVGKIMGFSNGFSFSRNPNGSHPIGLNPANPDSKQCCYGQISLYFANYSMIECCDFSCQKYTANKNPLPNFCLFH